MTAVRGPLSRMCPYLSLRGVKHVMLVLLTMWSRNSRRSAMFVLIATLFCTPTQPHTHHGGQTHNKTCVSRHAILYTGNN